MSHFPVGRMGRIIFSSYISCKHEIQLQKDRHAWKDCDKTGQHSVAEPPSDSFSCYIPTAEKVRKKGL